MPPTERCPLSPIRSFFLDSEAKASSSSTGGQPERDVHDGTRGGFCVAAIEAAALVDGLVHEAGFLLIAPLDGGQASQLASPT